MPIKHCASSYRIINGVRYEQWTDDANQFKYEIIEAQKLGLRFRIDRKLGRMWREVQIECGKCYRVIGWDELVKVISEDRHYTMTGKHSPKQLLCDKCWNPEYEHNCYFTRLSEAIKNNNVR